MQSLTETERWLIRIGCLVPFISSIALMAWYWPGSLPQDSSSGVWTALAQDFARGVFYRPTADAFGFGGTRYMPMFFVLHGSLIRLSLDPVAAGLILTVASLALFDIALCFTLHEFGVEWSLAFPLCVLAHAAVSFQLLSLQVKGDFLAAALNMWGICFGLRYARRASGLSFWASAAAFLGAFLTKFTTIGGAVAVCGWLYGTGQRRRAVALAGTLALLGAGAFGFVVWSSAGRALASFLAVADGGTRPGYALGAPLWFLLVALQDPVFLLLLGVASWCAVTAVRAQGWRFPAAYFVVAAALTVVIFTSPGTDTNHFIDLIGAVVLLLGWRLTTAPGRARVAAGVPVVLAGLTAATWIPGMISVKSVTEKGGKPERRKVAAIVTRLGPSGHDLLSENPILPVLAGERPRVLDPFNLRLLALERPDVAAEFRRRMSDGSFGAVVLVDWTGSDPAHVSAALRTCTGSEGDRCYGEVVFPPGFLQALERNYVLSFVEHPFVVYQPRFRSRQLGVAPGPAGVPSAP